MRLLRADEALPAPADAGCYTSVAIFDGRPRFREAHIARLQRDARQLEIPRLDARRVVQALDDLARAAFAGGDGVVRIEAWAGAEGRPCLRAVPRPFGPDRPTWRAVSASHPHPGPHLPGGPKLSRRPELAAAAAEATAAGADEALLFDSAGRLVEGSRSNVLLVDAGGRLWAPPPERGAVAGITLALLRARRPDLRHRDFSRAALLAARGVVALNAVRGARALLRLDGEALGDDGPELAAALDAVLEEIDPRRLPATAH